MSESFSREELQALLKDFCEEAREHLSSCEQALLELEKNPGSDGLARLKNSLHCIKGSSRAVGLPQLSSIVHGMESGLQAGLDKKSVDPLLRKLDTLKEAIQHLARGDEAAASKLLEEGSR